MTILSHDHQDVMMMQEYDETNTAITNGYKSKTFTLTLSKKGDLVEIITQQKHLGSSEKNELLTTLQQHEDLFNGELGTFTPYEIELELKPNPSPKASRVYPVPNTHLAAYKKRLEEMTMLGVLECAPQSEWIHGTFIIPKKDVSTCWIYVIDTQSLPNTQNYRTTVQTPRLQICNNIGFI